MFQNPKPVWSNGLWERRDLTIHSGQNVVEYRRRNREFAEIIASREGVTVLGQSSFADLTEQRQFQEIFARAVRQHLHLKFGEATEEPDFMDALPRGPPVAKSAAA